MLTKQQYKLKHSNEKRRVRRAQCNMKLYSCELPWGKSYSVAQKRTDKLVKVIVKRIVLNNMIDNMKAPMGNPAQPALFAPSAFNIYFGANVGATTVGCVKRAAYATYSGNASIGLDPRFAILNHIDSEMEELRYLIQNHVMRHYKDSEDPVDCNFNHMSVKVYYNKKRINAHTDIEFNKQHTKPKDSNSQVPMTPVAIMCLGDEKYLQFIKFEGAGKGKQVTQQRGLTFLQERRKIIVLDPRDEYLDPCGTYWKHRSTLMDADNGVCVSLMFRVVKAELNVRCENNRIVNAKVGGTGAKKRQFDKGWRKIGNNKKYTEKCKCIEGKIVSAMSKYW